MRLTCRSGSIIFICLNRSILKYFALRSDISNGDEAGAPADDAGKHDGDAGGGARERACDGHAAAVEEEEMDMYDAEDDTWCSGYACRAEGGDDDACLRAGS